MCGDSQPGGHVQASPDSLPRSQPSGLSNKLVALTLQGQPKPSRCLYLSTLPCGPKKAKAAHLLGVRLAVVHRRRQLRERLELAAFSIQMVKQYSN